MVLGGRPPGRVGHCQETFSIFNKFDILYVFRYNYCASRVCSIDLVLFTCNKERADRGTVNVDIPYELRTSSAA